MNKVLISFFVLACASSALADGRVFSRMDPPPEMPDQRALIYFRDGTERLVIDTYTYGTTSRAVSRRYTSPRDSSTKKPQGVKGSYAETIGLHPD